MNLIMASLLLHADKYLSYYLFTKLLNDYGLQTMFKNSLKNNPEDKTLQTISEHLKTHLPLLHDLITQIDVDIQMIFIDWILSLMTTVLPVPNDHAFFLENFFKHGWNYFYAVCIVFLSKIDIYNLDVDDGPDFVILVKKMILEYRSPVVIEQGITEIAVQAV